MSGRSPRPDFGRTDYRFKINDNFGMLHETTLKFSGIILDYDCEFYYNYNIRVPLARVEYWLSFFL